MNTTTGQRLRRLAVVAGQRIAAAGYRASGWGENIAAGDASVTTVVQGWLDSPGHCTTLMGANYQDFGASCRYQAGSTYRYYWTTDFGRR